MADYQFKSIWLCANATIGLDAPQISIIGAGLIYDTQASGVAITSDERIKNNITLASTSDAYATVAQVEKHEYNYNRATNTRKTRWGFIAQQLEEVMPEAVLTMPGNYTAEGDPINETSGSNLTVAHTDQKYVSKDKMFQCLFAAFQESQKKIASLEVRLTQLEGN